jgi:asparagine synthase (glutamine-hydrolysing)
MKTYLPNDILTKVDVASMMHGLEVRTPIVDVKVVEFASTIPESYNMRLDGGQRWVGKGMLKKIASKWYPRDFLNRRKQGFAMPIWRWFGKGGSLAEALTERLQDPSSPLRDYFMLEGMNELIRKEAAGPMWLFLFLDEWLRRERNRYSR